MLSKKLISAISDLGWDVESHDHYYCLENYSPAGEDLVIEVSKNNAIDEILQECENYDYEEHASLWLDHRGKGGVPYSIQALLDDASSIGEMYENLEYCIKHTNEDREVMELDQEELDELKQKVFYCNVEDEEEFSQFADNWDDEIQLEYEKASMYCDISNKTIYKLFSDISFVDADFFCNCGKEEN